jgi:Tol biopolymer transport system component
MGASPAGSATDVPAAILFKRNTANGAQIWLVAADGRGLRPLLPKDQYDVSRWSPDGRRVALSTVVADRVFASIVDADGTGYREIHPEGTLNCGAPTWSPDGQWIALECWDDTTAGRDGIYMQEVDGSGFRRLTQEHDIPGGFSPDGTRLVYWRASTGEVRIIGADGSGDVSLGVSGARGLDWMPDGQSLVTSIDGKLVLMDDTGTIERLIEAPNGNAVEPHPSRDGSQLVFAFDVNDPNVCCMSIATINIDGSGFTEIVPIVWAEQSAPDWRTIPE